MNIIHIKIKMHVFLLVHQSPVQDTDSDSEEENPRRSRPRSEKFNCEVKVISGELAKMRVILGSKFSWEIFFFFGVTKHILLGIT